MSNLNENDAYLLIGLVIFIIYIINIKRIHDFEKFLFGHTRLGSSKEMYSFNLALMQLFSLVAIMYICYQLYVNTIPKFFYKG